MLDESRVPSSLWAICDERGFLREATPGFIHLLRRLWPQWQGSRLPQALLADVQAATPCAVADTRFGIVAKGAYRYVEVRPAGPLDTLTPREREVAEQYARGESSGAIARALGLSPATVRNHLASCYRKLAVNNRSELTLRVSAGATASSSRPAPG